MSAGTEVAVTRKDLDALREAGKKKDEQIETLTKSLNSFKEQMAKTPAAGSTPGQVFGSPFIRSGEDVMGSRGFSFLKALGMITGQLDENQAKHEVDMARRMHQALSKEPGSQGYQYGGKGAVGATGGKMLAPFATNFLHDEFVSPDFRREMHQMVKAGSDGADHDEARWIRMKMLEQNGITGTKALSWLNELTGGALVAPPEQGELIELLRNKEALINAGARVVPLPPQGRLRYPRQTSASLAYWVGENAPIGDSNIGTGDVSLQAKKLAVMIKAPNELIRFASPAAEALMRDDMSKTLALGLDLAGLEGVGSDNMPRGVLNHPNIHRLNSSVQGANGDTVVGQDIYRMVASIEEANAEMEGFIMRPKTLYKFLQLRFSTVAANDQQGGFLFSLIREAGDGFKAMLGGYPVTKSTQVSQSRSKGTSNELTYIAYGMWSDMLIGMFGALEFAATTVSDGAFTNDQTWVRAILSADVALRHEAAFGILDSLDTRL